MQMLMQNQKQDLLAKVLGSLKNINNALEIAQSKGTFTLQQSAIIYKALQDVNEYFSNIQNPMNSFQTQTQNQNITHMTKEEAEHSAAQEERGIILNEAEQKELQRITEIENQIAKAVETSSESEENQDESEDEVENEVEDEYEDENEDEDEDEVNKLEEDIVVEVDIQEQNTLPSDYFTKQYQQQKRKRIDEEDRVNNTFYSDSDDDETIEI